MNLNSAIETGYTYIIHGRVTLLFHIQSMIAVLIGWFANIFGS